MLKLNKKIFFLLITLLILLLVYFFGNKQTVIETPRITKEVVKTASQESILESSTDSAKPLIKTNKAEKFEPIPLIYSDSEIINAFIIESKYFHCQMLLGKDHTGGNYFDNEYFKQKSKDHQNLILKYYEQCALVHKNQPQLQLNKPDDFFKYKKQLHPSSFLEKVLLGKIKLLDETEEDLFHKFFNELSNSSNELFANYNAIYFIGDYHYKFSFKKIMPLLQTQDISYAMSILDHAQTYYNCTISKLCGKESGSMFFYCIHSEKFCEIKSYKEFYELTLTPGQYADMLLLLPYIDSLFNGKADESSQN